jgi:hypothetical protein
MPHAGGNPAATMQIAHMMMRKDGQREQALAQCRKALALAPCDAADLFAFDFGTSKFCAPAHASVTCVATGGRVNGIAQWIALEMDEDTRNENRPAAGSTSCWAALFHPLLYPIDASSGQEIRVFGSHDRHRFRSGMIRQFDAKGRLST